MSNSQLDFDNQNYLSETLTSILRSAFSENFPDSLIAVLSFLTPPSEPNLLETDSSIGADFTIEDLIPLFFNEDPEQNFPNIIATYVDFLTTSSEPNILAAEDQPVKIIWGRHGADTLIGFDPSADNLGELRIDVFTGDFTDEKLFGALTGQIDDSITSEWPDRFILGDWQQPYYLDNQEDSLGLNKFALITDFNPTQDSIQLNGTAQDYQLVETDLGTAIFWHNDTGYDMVGLVAQISDLSLEGEYFDFQGNTPPEGPSIEEAQQIGTTGIDFAFASTVDSEGNLYVGGSTGGSLAEPNLGARDSWLTKYDSSGNYLWSKQFGTSEIETVWAMASDGSNTYVSGTTKGDLDGTNQGGADVYLAKYDSDGNQEWIRQFGTLTFDEAFKLTADSNGNVYVGGHTIGGLDGPNNNVGQDFGNPTDFGFPSTDAYVAKFDSEGNQVWIEQFGTTVLDDNWGVAFDQDGNVFAGGNTRGDFGGENAGFYDGWLVKLNENGEREWTQQFGTSDYDFLWDIETDSVGNVYATGWTLADLGGENAGDGSYDVWLTKYDTDGNQVWIKQFGTAGDDAPFFDGLEIDSNDNIFLSGYTDDNLAGENAGSYDSWVARYDTDGNQVWIKQFGTPDYDTATTINADSYGNLYVSGITEGSLGGVNAGSYDSWVVKLDAEDGEIEDFTGDNFSANEQLNGTNADDIIQGGVGNDQINGNGGNDYLAGKAGDDKINGGSIDDFIDGGLGNDTIYGNGGEDILIGGDGSNLVYGGSQADKITTGNGNDTIYGNGGEDMLIGGDGSNLIYGGSQSETIITGNGNDTIYSNGGDDYISSGSGLDMIWLGTGNTTVVLQIEEGYDDIDNFQLGTTKLQVSSLDNLSFSDNTEGVKIYQESDLVAFVRGQNAANFTSNIDTIFVV